MEQNPSSPADELAVAKKELHRTRSQLLALGAVVYAASTDGAERSARIDVFDKVLEGLLIDLKRFFEQPEDWVTVDPFPDTPETPGDETEPPPGDLLPPAVRACVTKYSFDLRACDRNSNYAQCRYTAWDNYKKCMESVVLAEPYSPAEWDAPTTPGHG